MTQTGKIGIIGGGQLGQMLTQAALPLGFSVTVLDPVANAPAAQAGATQIVQPYNEDSLIELASQTAYLTTEFEEGLKPEWLEHLVQKGITVNPAPQTIALILDKLDQKNFVKEHGVAVGAYAAIENAEGAAQLLSQYGGKMVVKARRGGYDGYGNRVVTSAAELAAALKDFAGRPVYAEAFVPFAKELAVMVVRSQTGEVVTYPVAETIQKNSICHEVLAPANIPEDVRQQAKAIAVHVAGLFEGAGAFGIELFLTEDGEVLLNEIAPRVHNSGHYTIEACQTSQFEQHIRAVSGLPLGSTDMKVPAAVMINILGERDGPASPEGIEQAESDPQVKVHIYGKAQTKVGRKMGHLTAVGETLQDARQRAETAQKAISI